MATCCEPGEVLPLAAPIFFTGVYVGVPGPLSCPVLRPGEPAEKRMLPRSWGCASSQPSDALFPRGPQRLSAMLMGDPTGGRSLLGLGPLAVLSGVPAWLGGVGVLGSWVSHPHWVQQMLCCMCSTDDQEYGLFLLGNQKALCQRARAESPMGSGTPKDEDPYPTRG